MSEFVEVKTAELTGPALDWAVAVVEGESVVIHSPNQRRFDVRGGIHCSSDGCTIGPRSSFGDTEDWSPSTDWAQGGPMLEKYSWALPYRTIARHHLGKFEACTESGKSCNGDTPLIAACRAIVAAKLGGVVQVPAELVGVV